MELSPTNGWLGGMWVFFPALAKLDICFLVPGLLHEPFHAPPPPCNSIPCCSDGESGIDRSASLPIPDMGKLKSLLCSLTGQGRGVLR